MNGFDFIAKSATAEKESRAAVLNAYCLLPEFPNVMQRCHEREVVVEIEHTRVVRKRTGTKVQFCRGCRISTDFVSLIKAAELFDTSPMQLFEFTQTNSGHFLMGIEGEIFLCLADLLTAMSRQMKTGKVKLLGEK